MFPSLTLEDTTVHMGDEIKISKKGAKMASRMKEQKEQRENISFVMRKLCWKIMTVLSMWIFFMPTQCLYFTSKIISPSPPFWNHIFPPPWIMFDEFFLFFNYPKFWVIFQLFFALISMGSKYCAFFLPHFLVTF